MKTLIKNLPVKNLFADVGVEKNGLITLKAKKDDAHYSKANRIFTSTQKTAHECFMALHQRVWYRPEEEARAQAAMDVLAMGYVS